MPNYNPHARNERIRSFWVPSEKLDAVEVQDEEGNWICQGCSRRNDATWGVCRQCRTKKLAPKKASEKMEQFCGPRAGHVPVICNPTVAAAIPMRLSSRHGTFVDCTFGRGGHTAALLSRLSEHGRLYAFDVDPTAIEIARQLERTDPRFHIIHRPFGDLAEALPRGVELHGVVMDLGVSSPQLDEEERGFIRGPLDLRMNQSQGRPASELMAELSSTEIAWVLREGGYGNDPLMAARMGEAIVRWQESHGPFRDAQQFSSLLGALTICDERGQHPVKLASTAFRIWMNHEVPQFEQAIAGAFERLVYGGRCVVITFKFSETSMLTRFVTAHEEPSEEVVEGWSEDKILQCYPLLSTSKPWCIRRPGGPIFPTEEEVRYNKRSRSAATHVLEKWPRRWHRASAGTAWRPPLLRKVNAVPEFGGAEVQPEPPEPPPAMGCDNVGCQYAELLKVPEAPDEVAAWLLHLDPGGGLQQHRVALGEGPGPPLAELLRAYASDGALDVQRLCQDLGIHKVEHRRLVEDWAAAHAALGADDRWLGATRHRPQAAGT